MKYILKKYQRPNNNPSSKVLAKLLDFSASPALSGTAVALTSNRSILVSETRGGRGFQGLSREGDEEKDQDSRGKTTLLEASRSCRVEEARIGPHLAVKQLLTRDLRGLRRGSAGEEETVKAALCIFVIREKERSFFSLSLMERGSEREIRGINKERKKKKRWRVRWERTLEGLVKQ